MRSVFLSLIMALTGVFAQSVRSDYAPVETEEILLQLIRPNVPLSSDWLDQADAIVKAHTEDASSVSLQVLRGITRNFRRVFTTPLKNEQVLFFKEFFAGMITATKKGKNNWPVHLARQAVSDTILRLYAAEYQLHLIVNQNQGSRYLEAGALKDLNFNCDLEVQNLPTALQTSFARQCREFQSRAQEQGLQPRLEFKELLMQANEKFSLMLRKRDELRARENVILRSLGRSPTPSDLLADSQYSQNLLELRSCQATFFDGSDVLSPLLRRVTMFQDYFDDYKAQRAQPLLPARAPLDRRSHELEGRIRNSDGTDLTPSQVAESLSLHLLSTKHDLLRKTAELRRMLTGEYMALDQEARTGLEMTDRSIKWMAHFPLAAGATMAQVERLNWKIWPNVLAASTYFSDRNEVFGNRMFYTGLLSLGSLFVPGPNVAVGMGMTFKAGSLIYAALLASQMALIAEHMHELSGANSVAQREELLHFGSPFSNMKSEEIQRGLFDGGLNSAFLIAGETLAGLQVGKEVISSQAYSFVRWFKGKHAKFARSEAKGKYLAPVRSWMQTELGPRMNLAQENMRELINQAKKIDLNSPEEGLKQLQTVDDALRAKAQLRPPTLMNLPTTKQGFRRARFLAKELEADENFQKLLREAVSRIPTEADRKIFLDSVIENIFINAGTSANLLLPKKVFLKLARENVETLLQTYETLGRFKVDVLALLTVAPNPLNKAANDLRAALAKIPQRLANPRSSTISDPVLREKVDRLGQAMVATVQGTVEATIKSRLEMVESLLTTINLRGQFYPFAKAYADDAKRIAMTLMEDPEVRQLFFAGIMKIDSPGFSMLEAKFYIEKILTISEVIDAHLARLSTQGGVTYSNIRESVLHALREINQTPADFALKMVEMTGIVSRLLVANNLTAESRTRLQEQAAALQPVNCSLAP